MRIALLRMSVTVAIALALSSACGGDGWQSRGATVERVVEVKARGIDIVRVHVCAPNDGAGGPRTDGAGMVLMPESSVGADRYAAFARALCAAGLAVAIPEFPFDTPALAADNAIAARKLLARGNDPAGIPALAARPISLFGHGDGGGLAANVAGRGEFGTLVLFGSAPDASDANDVWLPVFSIAGGRDCRVDREDVRRAWERFEERSVFADAALLSHESVTDASPGGGSCAAGLAMERGHEQLAELVTRFIDAALAGDREALGKIGEELDGVVVEVRQ